MGDTHLDDDCRADDLDAAALFCSHRATGEPLSEDEVAVIVATGLATTEEFGMRGGGCHWHSPTFPDAEAEGQPATIQVIDACPACGGRALVAVCRATVEYAVTNEQGGQSWDRREVDDDDSTPSHFRCGNCGAEFRQFRLDDQGHLTGLGPADSGSPAATPEGAMTAGQFQDWLAERVDDWSHANGLTPHGEATDLGDLYRELDDTGAFEKIGVTLIPAYDEQTLFIVGAGAAWIVATGIELGIENETIWHDPLGNLRLDVPKAELAAHRDRLRRVADEITALLGE